MNGKGDDGIKWHVDLGDGLLGERLCIDARGLGQPKLVNRSHRHKAQQIVARDDARAWIEIPRKSAAK